MTLTPPYGCRICPICGGKKRDGWIVWCRLCKGRGWVKLRV